jgi:hypothetical protein
LNLGKTSEFREDIEAALNCVADIAARAESEGVSLLCFPEGDETLWTSRHPHSRLC